jgi:hypothetical protein
MSLKTGSQYASVYREILFSRYSHSRPRGQQIPIVLGVGSPGLALCPPRIHGLPDSTQKGQPDYFIALFSYIIVMIYLFFCQRERIFSLSQNFGLLESDGVFDDKKCLKAAYDCA